MAASRELELAADPYWLTLLHVQPGLFGSSSLVDDPAFFLSPTGKRDPQAELDATLHAILAPVDLDHPKQHAGYRFPARQAWLSDRLGIPKSALGLPVHEDLQTILRRVDPHAVSIVYPFAYMNSPASLFGHTLLNIKSGFESDLLNQAINYAALATDTNGILFAIKGVLGSYPGYYHIVPYYEKVNEYNDINQRDIWEYRLNLTPEEIHRLMLHAWELRDIYSDYFFFDENCSFQLLFLLDAARPGLDLAGRTRSWVIPMDTVRLALEHGLVEEAVFRPSQAAEIRHLADQLSPPQLELALTLSRGERTWDESEDTTDSTGAPLMRSEADRALVLDLAVENLQLRLARQEIERKAYTRRFRHLLGARSTLDPAHGYLPPIIPPLQPDAGHNSARLSLGIGSEDDVTFGSLKLRPAYHDLLDADPGYLPGSQIDFLQLDLRWYDSPRELELQRFELVTIRSYSPRDTFFKPASWKIEMGFEREYAGEAGLARQFYFNSGGGFTWPIGDRALVYALLEGDARAGDIESNYALGLGPAAGLIWNVTDWWKLHAWSRYLNYPAGDQHEVVQTVIKQRFHLSRNTAIGASYEHRKAYGETWQTALVEWMVYF